MANYRKSFNFRSGVQVDNDKFLVDGRGNVGVGTSAPSRPLDVYGKARVNDQLETEDFQVVGVSTFQGMVSVGSQYLQIRIVVLFRQFLIVVMEVF